MAWAREYHIHVDATWIDPEFEAELTAGGDFYTMDFTRMEGEVTFAPERHLTAKFTTATSFRRACDALFSQLEGETRMEGYVEAECVGPKHYFENRRFRAVPPPFKIETRSLEQGEFREAEIHLTFDHQKSDSRAIAALRGLGLYSAFTEKSYGLAQILTIQGRREEIAMIASQVTDYISETGGLAHASIMEERITRYWLSDPNVARPPVISKITRRTGPSIEVS